MLEYAAGNEMLATESLSKEDCAKWKNQLRDGVKFLHQHRVMWVDVKLSIILVSNGGRKIKRIDFGHGYTRI